MTASGYNYSSENNLLPGLATLGQDLPKVIPEPLYEDTIQEGDSDEETLLQAPVEPSQKFLDQIEVNADLK